MPGNAGTSEISQNIDVDINDFNKLYEIIKNKKIDILVVGPEMPLVNGITDFFEEKKIKVAGQPKLDLKSYGEGKDLNYTLEIDELPSIKLKSIENIKFIDYEIKVTEKEIEKDLIIERLMNCLDLAERTCITLSVSAGMSHQEICTVTKFPLGTVKSHINRGKQKLMEKVNNQVEER